MSGDDVTGAPGRWPLVVLVAVVIAALAFGIGRFTAFGATAVPAAPSTTSAEAGFARDMQFHHSQAVEMALEIYRKTDDDTVRTIAYDIATTQSAQRGEMYGWLVEWGLPQAGGQLMSWMATGDDSHAHGGTAKTDDELHAEMGMATASELADLRAADGTAADCRFLTLMIRHHEGAIPMADAVIDLGTQPRVLTVARSMVKTQTAEIDAMRAEQLRLGCTG